MSVKLRTGCGTGTVTTTSSRTGEAGVPLPVPPPLPLLSREGVLGPLRPAPDREAEGYPGKLVLRVNRTSNSDPVGPRDFSMSTNAGRKTFSMWLGGWSDSGSMGMRSTS